MKYYLIILVIFSMGISQFKSERQQEIESLLNAPCCFGGVLAEHDSPLSKRISEIVEKLISEDVSINSINLELDNMIIDFNIATSPDQRTLIHSQLQDQMDNEEIIEAFVLIFGERVRSVPRQTGLGKLAWTMPIVFIILGLIFITIIIMSFSNKKKLIKEEKLSDEDISKIETQLQNQMKEYNL